MFPTYRNLSIDLIYSSNSMAGFIIMWILIINMFITFVRDLSAPFYFAVLITITRDYWEMGEAFIVLILSRTKGIKKSSRAKQGMQHIKHNWVLTPRSFFLAILAIIFWYILMFDKIFVSPQVNRIVIISNKHGIYELPHELSNDLRLRTLGN